MDQQTWIITFDNVSSDEANRYASELRAMLLEASPDIEAVQKPSSEYAQGWGDTLVAVLGTGAAVTAIQVIGIWLRSGHNRVINIEEPNFKYQAKGLTRKDYQATLVEWLPKYRQESKGEEK